MAFFGCYVNGPPEPDPAADCAADDFLPTPISDAEDTISYRHFAVDDKNDIVYFCDAEAYSTAGDRSNRLRCFANNREEGNGMVWNGEAVLTGLLSKKKKTPRPKV